MLTASYSGSGNFAASSTAIGTDPIITTVAGNGISGGSGDDGPATAAEMNYPDAIAVDSAGDLFIIDAYNYRVREVNHITGAITTVAGNGIRAIAATAARPPPPPWTGPRASR